MIEALCFLYIFTIITDHAILCDLYKRLFMHKLLLPVLIGILYFNSVAIANVQVQPAEVIVSESIKVGAGQYSYYKFTLSKDEQLNLKISVKGGSNNKIDMNIVDMNNFQLFKANQRYAYFTSIANSVQNEGKSEFVAPQTNVYYLILDNRKALLLSRNVDVNVIKISNSSTQSSLNIQKKYKNQYTALKQVFKFNDFNIYIKTCGVENAFSNPDITMCIELIDNLQKQNLSKAIDFVFLHEVAHSFLNTWNEPAYDNEDVADELATVLSIMVGDERIALEAAEFWSKKFSKEEAISKLYIDDRHTISPQRATNIINWINEKPELMSRWATTLLPHMTNNILKTLQVKGDFQNRVSEEIKRRKMLNQWNIKG